MPRKLVVKIEQPNSCHSSFLCLLSSPFASPSDCNHCRPCSIAGPLLRALFFSLSHNARPMLWSTGLALASRRDLGEGVLKLAFAVVVVFTVHIPSQQGNCMASTSTPRKIRKRAEYCFESTVSEERTH